MKKYYNIAGLTVHMDSWGRTIEQAKPYLIEPCNDVDINISTTELIEQGFNLSDLWPTCSEDDQEYLGTAALFYRYLFNFDGMMIHSSCVVVDGRAYLFTADSGTGKSTHTRLWLDKFGDCAFILNDDKPAVRLIDGTWYAYGTPWSGKNDISVNVCAPIAGIAVLERGVTNEIERFYGIDAIQAIIKQINRPRWAQYRIKLLNLADKLITQVPVWKLRCNMDIEAADVAYEAMSKQ